MQVVKSPSVYQLVMFDFVSSQLLATETSWTVKIMNTCKQCGKAEVGLSLGDVVSNPCLIMGCVTFALVFEAAFFWKA